MEQKPENSVNQTANSVSVKKPPVLQVDFKKLDKGMLQTAKSVGIPLDAILNYVGELQDYNASMFREVERLSSENKAIIENFEPAVKNTVLKMIADERAKTPAPIQQQTQLPASTTLDTALPPSSPNFMAILSQAAPQLIQFLSQQQDNPLTTKFNTFMSAKLDQAINELTNPPPNIAETLGKALLDRVTASLGSKVATDITKTVTGE